MFAIKIAAPNDVYGNPRRGWKVYEPDGTYVGFVEEGYRGDRAIREAYPDAVVLDVFHVGAMQFKALKRGN